MSAKEAVRIPVNVGRDYTPKGDMWTQVTAILVMIQDGKYFLASEVEAGVEIPLLGGDSTINAVQTKVSILGEDEVIVWSNVHDAIKAASTFAQSYEEMVRERNTKETTD